MLLAQTIAVVLLAVAVAAGPPQYTSKYDNVDVDRILSNERVLSNYIKCIMDEGPCTAEGRELKKTLPDALSTECSKCSEKQKSVAEKVIKHLRQHRASDWKRLAKKYDPEDKYKHRYEEFVATSEKPK